MIDVTLLATHAEYKTNFLNIKRMRKGCVHDCFGHFYSSFFLLAESTRNNAIANVILSNRKAVRFFSNFEKFKQEISEQWFRPILKKGINFSV